MTFHTEGIILRRDAWRETGRMYVIYTRETGKVLAVGRGTRKVLSKLAAHLEPYSRVDLFLARGKRYETIAGANMTRPSEPLVADDVRHIVATFVAESFDQLVKWGERDERLWCLLDGFYHTLAHIETERISLELAGYLWRFMEILGYGPRLHECVVCEKFPTLKDVLFIPTSGAVCCLSCRPNDSALVVETVDATTLAEIRDLLAGRNGASIVSYGAVRVAHLFLEAHLDRPLATQSLLREIMSIFENRETDALYRHR